MCSHSWETIVGDILLLLLFKTMVVTLYWSAPNICIPCLFFNITCMQFLHECFAVLPILNSLLQSFKTAPSQKHFFSGFRLFPWLLPSMLNSLHKCTNSVLVPHIALFYTVSNVRSTRKARLPPSARSLALRWEQKTETSAWLCLKYMHMRKQCSDFTTVLTTY